CFRPPTVPPFLQKAGDEHFLRETLFRVRVHGKDVSISCLPFFDLEKLRPSSRTPYNSRGESHRRTFSKKSAHRFCRIFPVKDAFRTLAYRSRKAKGKLSLGRSNKGMTRLC